MWSTPDETPVALLRVRSDGSATAANRAWSELTGLTVDQTLAQGWLGFLRPADRAPVLEAVRTAAGSDRAVCVEVSGPAAPAQCVVRRGGTGSEVVLALVPASGPGTRVTVPAGPSPDVVAVIHELYAVSLGLASSLALVDGRAGHRISAAIDRLDRAIRLLRMAVVEERRQAASATPREDAPVVRLGRDAALRTPLREVPASWIPEQRHG